MVQACGFEFYSHLIVPCLSVRNVCIHQTLRAIFAGMYHGFHFKTSRGANLDAIACILNCTERQASGKMNKIEREYHK
jgi:hypothetical protein